MATWIDKLREWDYDWQPVAQWIWETVEYQAVRHGPIAYLVAVLIVVAILLSFPPTRGMTKTIVSSLFKMVVSYIQIVGSLVTVQLVGGIAKLTLTLFHKARIWIVELAKRSRE